MNLDFGKELFQQAEEKKKEDLATLKKQLKDLIATHDVTQADIAESLGTNRHHINKFLNTNSSLSEERLEALVDILEMFQLKVVVREIIALKGKEEK